MATPPRFSDGDEPLFDPAQPFKGVVVCCTSVPTELRVMLTAGRVLARGPHPRRRLTLHLTTTTQITLDQETLTDSHSHA